MTKYVLAPIEERFWARVNKAGPMQSPYLGPCWVWTGGASRGYGHLSRGRRTEGEVTAHRFAYELLRGEIPAGLQLDHLCRHPGCVNPAHLEPVTNRENTRRGITGKINGARQRAKTHCKQGHPYSPENTRMYRGWRYCRTCGREATRRHRECA